MRRKMLLGKFLLVSFVSAWCTFSGVYAVKCGKKPTAQLSLCQQFQLIRDLAPEESIVRLVRSHMANDIRFRKAVRYMLSADFKTTAGKIDATTTFQSLMGAFVSAGVNTADINSIGKIFDCVITPIIKGSRSDFYVGSGAAKKRSLNTFVQEVSRLIPAEELRETLRTLVAENREFAKFYNVMRDPSFRSQVMQGLISSDVSRYIKTLRHFQIDLSKLVEFAFNLFSLGPNV